MIEDMMHAHNEANAIRKIAQKEKDKRVAEGEMAGEPTKEDYKSADKSLAQELSEFAKEGSGEFAEINRDIEEKFKMRMEKSQNLEREQKRLLILECTGMDEILGRLTVLSDERLDATNIDMFDVTVNANDLPSDFNEIAGIVISGSPSDIAEKEQKQWIGKMEEFIKKALAKNIPVLGVCFGIQIHADIRGRQVPKNEGGREMGVWDTTIYLNENEANHPIFRGIDFQETANGQDIKKSATLKTTGSHAYHAEYDATLQAESMHGFNFTKEGYYYPMVEINGSFIGLQFHPEMSIPEGTNFLRSLVKRRAASLVNDGKDPAEILRGLDEYQAKITENSETPDNAKFLKNFVSMVFDKE